MRRHLKANPRFEGRIVSAMGMRAEQSRACAQEIPQAAERSQLPLSRAWLPIFDLSECQVFDVTREAGLVLHDLLAWDDERGVWFEDPGHMYKLARGWDMVPDDCDDPCESIPMNPKRRRERFLTDAEFTRFGQVLDEVSGNGSQVSAGAVTTIRLLMLTGCGKSEIMRLRWEHVDLDRAEIRIVDGKTGSRTVHLPPSTAGVLKALPRQPDNPWVVPGAKPGKHMTDIDGAWQSIRARAGLHDIRHSCASLPYRLAA